MFRASWKYILVGTVAVLALTAASPVVCVLRTVVWFWHRLRLRLQLLRLRGPLVRRRLHTLL